MIPDAPSRSRVSLLEWFRRWGETQHARMDIPHVILPVDQVEYPGALDTWAANIARGSAVGEYAAVGLFAGENEVLLDGVEAKGGNFANAVAVHYFNSPHDYNPFLNNGVTTVPALGAFSPLARLPLTQVLGGTNPALPTVEVTQGGVPIVVGLRGPVFIARINPNIESPATFGALGSRERPIRIRSYDMFVVQNLLTGHSLQANFWWREIPPANPPTRDGFVLTPL